MEDNPNRMDSDTPKRGRGRPKKYPKKYGIKCSWCKAISTDHRRMGTWYTQGNTIRRRRFVCASCNRKFESTEKFSPLMGTTSTIG
jgi:hypothetical protein